MFTLQQIIAHLSEFWEKQGCIIHQGVDLEVGAGTFNPATFLRCLGPEPYRTAYVEPSRRPQDGRYGENPNRIHLFHQYQVVIKPSPPEIKEIYLQSIAALGYNLKEHDIRFVHSDWEGPTLGAWGLGWEVWLDGMEITQFTYFQAVGSLPLNPIAVEITYGLERLAMYIQNVDSIFDIKWNEEFTLRDLIHRSEIEWSRYNFDEANTAMWLRHFDDFEQEAKRLITLNLPLPAYDFVIKASHAFNILDARGTISVTERTGYVARIRELSRLVAVAYVSEREKLGFPLLRKTEEKILIVPPFTPPQFDPQAKRDFLLEIGSEELPSAFISIGCSNLERAIRTLLEAHGISFESVSVFGSPQRLAILVHNLAEGTSPKMLEKRGPSIAAAFDAEGNLTNQGEGFFKSARLKPASLEDIRKGKVAHMTLKGDHLFASLSEEGKSTMALLATHLPKLILDLDFPKKMRWGTLDISYARPLRWITALFGDALIPFSVGNIICDRFSYGHAQLKPKKFFLKTANDYVNDLRQHNVLVDRKEREESIAGQLKVLEGEMGGSILEKNRVLKEVVNLVEWPQLTYAKFDQRFLKAPSEVLISEMVEHQKYFPVASPKGELTNFFVITADTIPNDQIRHGNEKVLSARLADGVFLYETDLKIPLENLNAKLEQMTFQKSLGTMLDKVMRLATLADLLNNQLKIADQKYARRAALLCKADLASSLVGEFPELQGTAGKYYALAQKEEREVAEAIEEHWMPRYENAPLPKSPVGILLSLADKFDNLLGYFSVGLKPTSSGDPYALRRQTLGILHILIKNALPIDLKHFLTRCTEIIPLFKSEAIEEILLFLTARSKTVFENYEMKKEEIEASLQGLCIDPFDQFCRIKALHTFRHSSAEFAKLLEVYKRAKGQLTVHSETPFNPSLAQEAAEIELIRALTHVEKHWKEVLNDKNYTKAFELIAALQPYLAHLFDTVKILAEDPNVRANRIALLQRVFAPFEDLVDFSKLN